MKLRNLEKCFKIKMITELLRFTGELVYNNIKRKENCKFWLKIFKLELTQKVVLAALTSALTNLFEEAAEATNPADLVQPGHGVQHRALVVVVPYVQVQHVRRYIINVTASFTGLSILYFVT